MRLVRVGLVVPVGLALLILGVGPPSPARLVKDINPKPDTRTPWTYAPSMSAAVVNGRVVLDVPGPAGLWGTDGTPEGTLILKDIDSSQLTPFQGSVYFWAADGGEGALWKTDGTRAGTVLVREIGPSSASPFIFFRGGLYFGVGDTSLRLELWKTDGTTEGTVLAADISLARASDLTVIGNSLYFFARSSRDPAKPFALYKTDGTESDTEFLKDFAPAPYEGPCPGPCFPLPPSGLVDLGGIAYFLANDGVTGQELWRSDGTPDGTRLVVDLCPGACSGAVLEGDLAVLQGRIFFSGNDGVHGFEPWSSDGTRDGTRLIKDVRPGPEGSSPQAFMASGSAVVFAANGDATGYSYKLWVTNGTEAGTLPLADRGVHPPILSANGVLYFPADRPPGGGPGSSTGWQLWRSDGSPGGTFALEDEPATFFTPIAESAGRLFFGGFGPDGVVLWKSDGSTGDRSLVRVLDGNGGSSNPASLQDLDGSLLFAAVDETGSDGLWRSDGSDGGTKRISSVSFRADTYFGPTAARLGGFLFFAGGDASGVRLWKTDGTDLGTRVVRDVGSPFALTVVGDVLFFSGSDADHGFELWKSDGTEAATVLVKDIEPGPVGSVPTHLVAFHGQLYFTATTAAGPGLWRSDGTEAGTFPIISGIGAINGVSVFGDWLAFTTYDALWKSDGTHTGTVLVSSVDPLSPPITAGRNLFFAVGGPLGTELWRASEGFLEVVLLKVITPDFADPRLVVVGEKVFFAAPDDEHGYELWASDGTPSGTRMVKDISPGPSSSSPSNLAEVGGVLVFSAREENHGREVWRSDGTEEGTWMVADVVAGPGSSNPFFFTRSGPFLYFSADDTVSGRELWAVPLSAIDWPGRAPRSVPWRD